MSSNKEQGLKDYLISQRKKIGPGLTNVPVWTIQKKGERIWNPKQKRTWKDVGFGKAYRKLKNKESGNIRGVGKKGKKIKKKLKGSKLGHRQKFYRLKRGRK
jgi:hypothetical protein